MTAIVDTSVWIRLFKDRSGRVASALDEAIGQEVILMPPPIRLELLQGCRGDQEWGSMLGRLAHFQVAPMSTASWDAAARIYYELRQLGVTVRSALDCCIAQVALESFSTLVHYDRDFETITRVRPLVHLQLKLDGIQP